MMRDYRGLTKDGEWVYGSLIDFGVKDKYICTSRHGYSYCHASKSTSYIHIKDVCKVQPETVGQQTGLKDKNGKEIYDSDILEIRDFAMITKPVRGEVIWFNSSWQIKDGGMLCIFDTDCLEIIGDIHQNKDLLND